MSRLAPTSRPNPDSSVEGWENSPATPTGMYRYGKPHPHHHHHRHGDLPKCGCVCEGSFQSILLNERAKDIYIEFFSSRRHLHSPGLSHPPSRTRQLEGCLSCRTANTHTHMSHPRSPGVVLPIKNISLPCQGSPENPNQTGSALCAAQN